MNYEQGSHESGWSNVTVWLSPEAVQSLKIVKERNGRTSVSEVVSRCLAEAAKIPSKVSGPDAVIAGILERLERVEDEVEQLREQALKPTVRSRTTVNKFQLAKAVAEWMVCNNNLGIHKIDAGQVWQELKSQGVVVHATYPNFRLWFKRNKDRIKEAREEAL